MIELMITCFGSTELYYQRTYSVVRKVNLIFYTIEIYVCRALSSLGCILYIYRCP